MMPRPRWRGQSERRCGPRGHRAVGVPEVGIGIAGYGMMAKAHSYAYTVAPVMRMLGHRPRLRMISGRDKEKVSRAAAAYGFESWTASWRDMLDRRDVDIVDICTPPGTRSSANSCGHRQPTTSSLRRSGHRPKALRGTFVAPPAKEPAAMTPQPHWRRQSARRCGPRGYRGGGRA